MFSTASAGDWPRQARLLLLVAMAVFLVTVVIGILNGLDLVDFSTPDMRNTLLTHVHSGTLGWISLGLIATALWLTRSGAGMLAPAFAVLIPVYVAAFYSGNYPARAITGVLLLLAILWLVWWAWSVVRSSMTFPKLAAALGFTTFAIGAVIGVLVQVQGATGMNFFPAGADAVGAHASTMVFSYLVLVAMGLIEWQLMGTSGLPRGALVQIGALFVGGAILVLSLLFLGTAGAQSIGGVYLLLELVAVVLFAVRVVPTALRTNWGSASLRRHVATSAVFVVVAMLLFMYFISRFLTAPDPNDFASLPLGILVASDHATFIGVMTNLILAVALGLASDRRVVWAWADNVVYWVMNIGLAIFIVGLAGDIAEIKRVGAPLMGVGILVGLATAAMRLWSSNLSASSADGPVRT
jgi:hypothetical protein